jgi:hypothetical protein
LAVPFELVEVRAADGGGGCLVASLNVEVVGRCNSGIDRCLVPKERSTNLSICMCVCKYVCLYGLVGLEGRTESILNQRDL